MNENYMTLEKVQDHYERSNGKERVIMNDQDLDRFVLKEKDNRLKPFFEDFLRTNYSYYECFTLPSFEIENDFVIEIIKILKEHKILLKI